MKIARLRDDVLTIDDIAPDKELVITSLLGLPPSWGAFATGFNSWKFVGFPQALEGAPNYSQR